MPKNTYPLVVADPHIVTLLTNHLINAFEQFIDNYPGKIDYIDGFMAAHNFHKAIVGHLVEQTSVPELWSMALATFSEAVKRETS